MKTYKLLDKKNIKNKIIKNKIIENKIIKINNIYKCLLKNLYFNKLYY
jgi:hypothetical protein